MKKHFMIFALAGAAITGVSGISYADISDAMKDSKYCRENSADPICMGPESLAMRKQMMEMSKDSALEARTKYCRNGTGTDDPICDPKMMNDTTGY